MIDPARLDRLFAEVLDRPAGERAAFIALATDGHAELRRELEALLRAHDAATDFLADPAPWLAGAPAPKAAREPMATTGGPWLGHTLSHYEVLEPIAAGGMGVVFKARDTKLDRLVTLKFLHPHLRPVPRVTERFVQEAKAASALDHPNICTIYEIDETPDGQLFIAMAYYAGETLKERMARGPLSVPEGLAIARAIAAGLGRAHDAGIVHRDLKPANVILTDRGEVKILDFGIAKLEGAAEITASGARLGTVGYMSPEQVRGDPVDQRADVWALGVVLAELLTGTRPFTGDNDAAIVRAIDRADPVFPPGLAPGVARVLRQALAKDPASRLESMEAFGAALDALAAGRTPPALPATPARRRRMRRLALAVTLAVAAFAVLMTMGRGRGGGGSDDAASLPRIGVLPFENLGPPEDEYFVDGITDEVISRLATIRGLAVLGRQSAMRYKGTDKPPAAIGEELAVEYLLEATVSWEKARDGPTRVRVRPQLIRVADGVSLWSETYEEDLTQVFAVQRHIAERVAMALDIRLLEPERRALARRPTDDLEAYDHYLRGNHFLLQRDRQSTIRAIAEYRAAAAIDPAFAGAHARVAYAFGLMADFGWSHPTLSPDSLLQVGFDAVDRALELNPRSADAWMARAYLLVFRNPDTYAGVADAFTQAITYDPNNAEAHHQYASMIGRLGLTATVEQLFHRALLLEPKHAIAMLNLGFFYLIERRYDEALRLADSAVTINPALYHVYEHRAQIRSHLGMHDAARADAEAAIAGSDSVLGVSVLALVTARAGDVATARWAVERALAGDRPVPNESRMWAIAAFITLGDTAPALDLLRAERERLGLVYLRHLTRQPDFDPLRDDPRFREIVDADAGTGG